MENNKATTAKTATSNTAAATSTTTAATTATTTKFTYSSIKKKSLSKIFIKVSQLMTFMSCLVLDLKTI